MRSLRAVTLAFGLVAVACGSGSGPGGGAVAGEDELSAQVASADLYVGDPQRLLVGVFADDGRLLSYGRIRFETSYLGTPDSPEASPRPGPAAQASYVPTPGLPGGGGQGPTLTQPSESRGIYQAQGLVFDRPGFWQVEVQADVADLGAMTATASFVVLPEPSLPAPGDEALPTENLTLRSKHAPLAAVDSAAADGTVPDPELHRWTIARALEQGRPALVVFATPVYCQSRFCGPVVEAVEELADRYKDRAVFIHVEIWHDYQEQAINRAAADWLLRDGDLTEPWMFLIGADGRIIDRWGSLWDPAEVSAALEGLPPGP